VATQPRLIESAAISFQPIATYPGMRALSWSGDIFYASRGYELHCASINDKKINWRRVAGYSPEWWRNLTCRSRLSYRLVRDGFHALAILSNGALVAAVPGAIVTLHPGDTEFVITHRLVRGTRPLHITVIPNGPAFWGEYFDNPQRDEVHVYGSEDNGATWQIFYTFGKRSIRHVHNIVYDKWRDCLWILTGDYGRECRILRASLDFKTIYEVIAGNQQARAVAAVPSEEGLLFASDTPLEQNYIYQLDARGNVYRLSAIPSSSIYACRNRGAIFFSTMIEPSPANMGRDVTIFGSADVGTWHCLAQWPKDRWSMKFFQYGNAFLPDGDNITEFLVATTIGVEGADLQMSIWRTEI
jgi:hypothetical protein